MSESKRHGDQAGSLRSVCDREHTQSVYVVNVIWCTFWGAENSKNPGGKGGIISFLRRPLKKLSLNSIHLPFSWDIGLLVAWFQNIHTCIRREVRKS